MHLRQELVMEAVERLGAFHPFFCKQRHLPVGKMMAIPINRDEEAFLQNFYHPDPQSRYFFQPFHTSSRLGRWLIPKYPSSGSQKTRTAGHFAAAFLHERNTDQWGWSASYVDVLRAKLAQDKSGLVPAFWLAVWLFRNEKWPANTRPADLIGEFLKRFSISKRESDALFDVRVPDISAAFLSSTPFDDGLMLQSFDPAPDGSPEEGGTLRMLQLSNIGPTTKLDFSPAERLSMITGDNGLGKTFVLECAWWALTGQWADRPALPNLKESRKIPSITFAISGKGGGENLKKLTIGYEWRSHSWPAPKGRPTIPGLIVYARVDGSFAVWDPVRHSNQVSQSGDPGGSLLLFTRDEVLNGLGEKIEGLIRDWVRWQNGRDQSTFEMFCKVLERLSPPDMSPLKPGEPIRLPGDPRDIPTLVHDYALVPFTNESAGVKRIVTIAYLLVWAWNEHRIYSDLAKRSPQNNIVIMIDEIEAHLHPKWQRIVLPALLDVVSVFGESVKPQIIVATHSPLILASMESGYSDEVDKLFHLYLEGNRAVRFEEVAFVAQGTVDAWLTSEVFELKQARSKEGETALEQAKQLLAASEANPAKIGLVHRELAKVLPADDPFWPRWLHFAEMKGVHL
jgi:AAA domain, putative AbiEii toxin, Type IV TA system